MALGTSKIRNGLGIPIRKTHRKRWCVWYPNLLQPVANQCIIIIWINHYTISRNEVFKAIISLAVNFSAYAALETTTDEVDAHGNHAHWWLLGNCGSTLTEKWPTFIVSKTLLIIVIWLQCLFFHLNTQTYPLGIWSHDMNKLTDILRDITILPPACTKLPSSLKVQTSKRC